MLGDDVAVVVHHGAQSLRCACLFQFGQLAFPSVVLAHVELVLQGFLGVLTFGRGRGATPGFFLL